MSGNVRVHGSLMQNGDAQASPAVLRTAPDLHEPRCIVTLERNITPTATLASSETVGPFGAAWFSTAPTCPAAAPAATPSCWFRLRCVEYAAPPNGLRTAAVLEVVAIACPRPCTNAA